MDYKTLCDSVFSSGMEITPIYTVASNRDNGDKVVGPH